MKSFSFFSNVRTVFISSVLLRAALLVYGQFQDQLSPLKYTDIDYFVFTDAARYVSTGSSPYLRDTYRYTPLLAWLLLPSSRPGLWFLFGKALFAASDVVAGFLIYKTLQSSQNMSKETALQFACLWLLNPMVAQISTRGSSEGVLAVMVIALLWATVQRYHLLAGALLGLAVHFKIYPFIYGAAIMWSLDDADLTPPKNQSFKDRTPGFSAILSFFNKARVNLILSSLCTFIGLNVAMYIMYGGEFLLHTFIYHLVRTDHRHNFSPYNILLYLNSSPVSKSTVHPEALAFIPQLLLSAFIIPLVLAKRDLPSCMLAQTFAFVIFNKVCTSQYFLWYLVFLPFYLPRSSLLQDSRTGWAALILWVVGQVFWLQQGFQLEFRGQSMFSPNLWLASSLFFAVNIWILGIIVIDVRKSMQRDATSKWKAS